MSPGRRAWVEGMVARLRPRIEALRLEPGRGPANRLHAIAGIVADFDAELAAAPPAPEPASPERVRLEQLLAGAQPKPGPFGLIINAGPVMDRVRARLAQRIEALGGPPAPIVVLPLAPAPIVPPPEPMPFTAGPQLALFAMELAA